MTRDYRGRVFQDWFMGTNALDHRARKRFEGFTEALPEHEVQDQKFYSGGSALKGVT